MFSRSIIDYSESLIDDSRVMLQLVASFTIAIYDHHVFTFLNVKMFLFLKYQVSFLRQVDKNEPTWPSQ